MPISLTFAIITQNKYSVHAAKKDRHERKCPFNFFLIPSFLSLSSSDSVEIFLVGRDTHYISSEAAKLHRKAQSAR